ncbi:MAG: hypothetical protein ACYTG0_08935 [Planctomycetota bacterium]|jgi:hypothetical protein
MRAFSMWIVVIGIGWFAPVHGPIWAADPPESLDNQPHRAHLAQIYYGGYAAGTPAESYARGAAALTRAQGAYNWMTARASGLKAEAERLEMENRLIYADTYFRLKELNRTWRARLRRPRLTAEQLARLAKIGVPARLSPGELDIITGEITWPLLLQSDRFANYRARLESLFAERARSDRLTLGTHLAIDRTTEALLGALKKQVHHVPQMDYVAAKRFIRSLAYEGRQPTG